MKASRMFFRKGLIFFVYSVLTSANSVAQTPADKQIPFSGASPEIREFLSKAEAADKIADPLARCLAFPDLPGNKWPQGLAKSHCDFSYGPRITLARARQLVESGRMDELDALFSADLDRHFEKENFSEVIHVDFDDFDNSYEAGSFTKLWLQKASGSPYALLARGFYYYDMAYEARGGKWSSETPAENLQRMSEFIDLAIDHYQRALKIEPRLLPAYIGLIRAGTLDSRPEIERAAILLAKKIDPACRSISHAQMDALRPRWGGSYAEMIKLSMEIEPFVAQRPLLTQNTVLPVVDMGDRLLAASEFDEAIRTIRPILALTTHPKPYDDIAKAMQSIKADNRWEALMYFLEARRFYEGESFENKSLGRLLLQIARKPEWASRYLKMSLVSSPDDAHAHYLLAASYLHMQEYELAEAEYLLALKGKAQRRDALYELSTTYILSKQPDKALEQVLVLNKEYPAYAKGWLQKAGILGSLRKPGSQEAIEMFLEKADRSDPKVRAQAEDIERRMKAAHALPAPKR